MSPPRGGATTHPIKTKLGRVGVPRNVITHAKFQVIRLKTENLARG